MNYVNIQGSICQSASSIQNVLKISFEKRKHRNYDWPVNELGLFSLAYS